MRIQQRQRLRRTLRHLVMVDDNHVDSHLFAGRQRLVITGAAVAGHNQVAAEAGQIMRIGLAKAVTISATGNARCHGRPGSIQEVGQQRAGGDSIDIVVTKNAHRLAIEHRPLEPLDSHRKAGHRQHTLGRTQVRESRVQVLSRLLLVANAAIDKKLCGQIPQSQPLAQKASPTWICGPHNEASQAWVHTAIWWHLGREVKSSRVTNAVCHPG
jgi:hypothetical protein